MTESPISVHIVDIQDRLALNEQDALFEDLATFQSVSVSIHEEDLP